VKVFLDGLGAAVVVGVGVLAGEAAFWVAETLSGQK
jgi:hypothetical protein